MAILQVNDNHKHLSPTQLIMQAQDQNKLLNDIKLEYLATPEIIALMLIRNLVISVHKDCVGKEHMVRLMDMISQSENQTSSVEYTSLLNLVVGYAQKLIAESEATVSMNAITGISSGKSPKSDHDKIASLQKQLSAANKAKDAQNILLLLSLRKGFQVLRNNRPSNVIVLVFKRAHVRELIAGTCIRWIQVLQKRVMTNPTPPQRMLKRNV
jgi:hypothetical protein